jgi:uncharacterized membrane protein YGL010W
MKHWFREQMAMYTAYHRNPMNCATHFVGVPLIVFALLVAMSLVPLGQTGGIPISAATVFLLALLILYVVMSPLVGYAAALVHVPMLWFAEFCAQGESPVVWSIIAACFIGGWIIQFIGHVFEGRRPALFDNILQVFMAPGFLVAETLFAIGLLGELKNDLQDRSRKYAIQ